MNQQSVMNMSAEKLTETIRSKRCTIAFLNIIKIIEVSVPAAIFFLGLILQWKQISIWGILAALSIPGYFLINKYSKAKANELREFMGKYVTVSVLSEQIQVLEYQPNGYISDSFLRNSNVLPHYASLDGSGYIHGIYKGMEFYFSNLKLYDEFRSPDGETDNREAFVGWFMMLVAKKSLESYGKTPQILNGFQEIKKRITVRFADNMAYISVANGLQAFEVKGSLISDHDIIAKSRQQYKEELTELLSVIDAVVSNESQFRV